MPRERAVRIDVESVLHDLRHIHWQLHPHSLADLVVVIKLLQLPTDRLVMSVTLPRARPRSRDVWRQSKREWPVVRKRRTSFRDPGLHNPLFRRRCGHVVDLLRVCPAVVEARVSRVETLDERARQV